MPNVIEMLEAKGVKVYEVEENELFDGMSTWVNGIPVIVINKDMNIVRKRFTALHELAHLVLEFSEDIVNEKEKERLCHNFAGAFLLPKEPFLKEFGGKRSNVSLEELKIIDEYYGISVQAIMARAKVLNLISEHSYRDFNIWLSKNGCRKKELGEYKGKESPIRFKKLLYQATAKGAISMSKAAALANKPLSIFEEEFVTVG